MAKLLDLPDALEKRRSCMIFDDFHWFISPHLWTSTLTDSGTATVGDAAKGILALVASDGTVADNDEAYLLTTKELFLFANNKPILFETSIQFTEANTDDANVGCGLMNAVAANSIVDDGAGLKTNFDGFGFYKVDGGTVWKCITSKGTTQYINTTGTTAGGSSYQTLRAEFRPVTSSFAEVHFFIDGVPAKDSTTEKPIVHRFDYSSSPTEMMAWAGVKNGSANNETLNIDYVSVVQLR